MQKGSLLPLLAVLSIISCSDLRRATELAFHRFKASSPSMTPAVPIGSNFAVVSADTFSMNQIVAFYPPNNENYPFIDTTTIWIFRLVGMPGDKMQMRKGELFVNGAPYPFPLELKHGYVVKTSSPLNEKRFEGYEYNRLTAEEYRFHATAKEVEVLKSNKIVTEITSMIQQPDQMRELNFFLPDGNRDNWGPIVVPASAYFVLGDNRHNALDSRYLGFIPKVKMKGIAMIDN